MVSLPPSPSIVSLPAVPTSESSPSVGPDGGGVVPPIAAMSVATSVAPLCSVAMSCAAPDPLPSRVVEKLAGRGVVHNPIVGIVTAGRAGCSPEARIAGGEVPRDAPSAVRTVASSRILSVPDAKSPNDVRVHEVPVSRKTNVSVPRPLKSVSLPPAPQMVSFPATAPMFWLAALPLMMSLPEPPAKRSIFVESDGTAAADCGAGGEVHNEAGRDVAVEVQRVIAGAAVDEVVAVIGGANIDRVASAEGEDQIAAGATRKRVAVVVPGRSGVVSEEKPAAVDEADVRGGELERRGVEERDVFAGLRAGDDFDARARARRR